MWNPFKKKEINLVEAATAVYDEPVPVYPEDSLAYQSVDAAIDIETIRESNIVEDTLTYRLKQAVRGILLALVVLLPVFFLTVTAPADVLAVSKQVLLVSAVLAGLVLWLVIVVRQGGLVLKRTGMEWGVGAWLAAALVAAVFAVQPARSLLAPAGFITAAALGLLVFLLVNFFEAGAVGKIVSYWLLGSLLAISTGLLALWRVPVFGWVDWLAAKGLTVGDQFNTVGSYNVLGALSALAVVLAAGQWFRLNAEIANTEASKHFNFLFWRVVRSGAAVVSVIALLVINYWGFYLTVAIGLLVLGLAPGMVQRLTEAKVRVRASAIAGPLAGMVLALLLAVGAWLGYSVLGGLGANALPAEVRLGYRPSLTVTGGALAERPVFGWGPGNYTLAYAKAKPAVLNDTLFWNTLFGDATAEVLNIATNYGLVGLAAFIALAGWVLRAARRRTAQPNDISSLWTVLPAFLATLALSLVFPFSNLILSFAFWLIIGLVGLAATAPDDDWRIMINNPSLAAVSASLGFILVLAVGLAGGYFVAQRWLDERAYVQVLRTNISDSASADRAMVALANLANRPTADQRYVMALGQILLRRINGALADKKAKPEEVSVKVQNWSSGVVQTAQVLTSQYANDPASWAVAGQLYENLIQLYSGADTAAVNAYGEARRRAPRDPALPAAVGQIYLSRADQNSAALADARRRGVKVQNETAASQLITADYKAAEDNLRQAVGLKSDYAAALYELGVVYERQNRLKDAIKQLQSASAQDFRNAGLAFELGLLYYRDNQRPNAFNEMSRAIALLPNYANARWYRALMLEEVGRVDDAISELNAILVTKENADNQTVKNKVAALQAGKREFPPGKITSKKPL